MLENILVRDLKPGMRVVDPGVHWMKRPFLYATDHTIATQEEIDTIISNGYIEAYIDVSDNTAAPQATPEVTSKAAPTVPPTVAGQNFFSPKVSLDEELPTALELHKKSTDYARKFMNDTKMGTLNLSTAEPFMDNIMESLGRNVNALVTLSRLQRNDEYTFKHCVNISILSTCFSKYLGQSETAVYNAGLTGLFHDVGKSLVPHELINAPRKLNDAELNIMKKHPDMGMEQLSKTPGINEEILHGAVEHHERFDGTGYPKGLSGEQISLIGRMVGIVDVFDALTSQRSYKEALIPHKALGMMYQMRDKDFDSTLLAHFIRMVGIYPVGSLVLLQGGWKAVVVRTNPDRATQPVVVLVQDPRGNPCTHKECDLARGEAPLIDKGISHEGTGIDPLAILAKHIK